MEPVTGLIPLADSGGGNMAAFDEADPRSAHSPDWMEDRDLDEGTWP